ncbi:MAG TPA: hypothetical protein VKG64_01360 [Methylomirabilota bacterium]|nr:hypothetical protein [Methylomirabilota bacterium]
MADDRRAPVVIGILTVVTGAVLYLATADILSVPERTFGAPRWIVAGFALGLVFGGFYALSLRLPTPVTGRVLAAATALTFLTTGGVFMTWLALGGGARGRAPVPLGPLSLLLLASGLEFAVFWVFALITDAIAVGAWIYCLRALVRRRPRG